MNGLIGKKVGVTRVFTPDGKSVPVTVILAGPNVIAQIKTPEKDGYSAVQLGFGERRHPTLPEAGHALRQAGLRRSKAAASKSSGKGKSKGGSYELLYGIEGEAPDFKSAKEGKLLSSFKLIREIRLTSLDSLNSLKPLLSPAYPEIDSADPIKDPSLFQGKSIGCELFTPGDRLKITGVSKGRGTSGVMKRHGFGGGRATHGCLTPRSGGSIGCAADPSRVVPGKKMAGHYGADKVTIKNLVVIDVRPDRGVILVKGSVPGPPGGLLTLRKL
jgi:large subunit ribosomal protein L3